MIRMMKELLKENWIMLFAILIYLFLIFAADSKLLSIITILLMIIQFVFWIKKDLSKYIKLHLCLFLSMFSLFFGQNKEFPTENFIYLLSTVGFLIIQILTYFTIFIIKLHKRFSLKRKSNS